MCTASFTKQLLRDAPRFSTIARSGCRAVCDTVARSRSSGNRWEISSSNGSSPLKTSRADSACRSTAALYEPNRVRSPTQMSAPDNSIRSLAEVCANSRILRAGPGNRRPVRPDQEHWSRRSRHQRRGPRSYAINSCSQSASARIEGRSAPKRSESLRRKAKVSVAKTSWRPCASPAS